MSFTHVVTRGIAEFFTMPDLNGRVICGKFIPFSSVNLNVLCDVDNGKDLAMIMVQDADQKSIT